MVWFHRSLYADIVHHPDAGGLGFYDEKMAGWMCWMSEGVVSWGLPTGKRLHSELENHHFQWEIQL